jgi:sec-independent protein translocase protein TatB
MFDIAFSEVLIIFVLALVVLGPEKLPKVAAQVGRWIGRARGMARQFREQLEEEVNLEEARKAQPPVTRAPPPPPPVTVPPAAEAATVHATPTAEVSPAPDTATANTAQPAPASAVPPLEAEQQIVYPDTYSHAHPTDELGRPVAPPTSEAPATAPGQQDWVGGVAATDQPDKPAQPTADAAYAPSHGRGT